MGQDILDILCVVQVATIRDLKPFGFIYIILSGYSIPLTPVLHKVLVIDGIAEHVVHV